MAGPFASTPSGFMAEVTNILAGGNADPGVAVYYLDALFGNWVSGTGSSYTLVTSSFVIINFLAFTLGVIIFVAALFGGITKSALRGEVLGQAWGSDTLPVKMFLGIALMMPVMVDGNVSLSQRWGMNLLLMGSAAGDYTWRKVLTNASSVNTPAIKSAELTTAGDKVLKASICAAALAIENADKEPLIELGFSKKQTGYMATKTPYWRLYGEIKGSHYAQKRGNKYDVSGTIKELSSRINRSGDTLNKIGFGQGSQCGSYTFGEIAETPETTTQGFNDDIDNEILKAGIAGKAAVVTMVLAHMEHALKAVSLGYGDYKNYVQQKAETGYSHELEQAGDLINRVNNDFIENSIVKINRSLSSGTNHSNSATQKASEQGWIYAGAWIMQLGRLVRMAPDAVNTISNMEIGSPRNICEVGFWGALMGNSQSNDCTAAQDINIIGPALSQAAADEATSDENKGYRAAQECSNNGCSTGEIEMSASASAARMILYALGSFGNISLSPGASGGSGAHLIGTDEQEMRRFNLDVSAQGVMDATGRTNPFATLIKLGHGLLNVGHTIELLLLIPIKTAQKQSNETGRDIIFPFSVGAFYLSNVLNYFAIKLYSLSKMFTLLGAMLAYLLPVMAMVRWLGPALGFVVVALEFHIVAPFAMMLLLIPEGSGIIGTQLLSVMRYVAAALLRPTLCVLGLVGGYVAAYVVFGLFNGIFWTGISLGTNLSLFEVVIAVYLYAFIAYQIMDKLFQLPISLTRDVLRWISPGNEPFGDSVFSQIDVGAQQLASVASVDVKTVIDNSAFAKKEKAEKEKPA